MPASLTLPLAGTREYPALARAAPEYRSGSDRPRRRCSAQPQLKPVAAPLPIASHNHSCWPWTEEYCAPYKRFAHFPEHRAEWRPTLLALVLPLLPRMQDG